MMKTVNVILAILLFVMLAAESSPAAVRLKDVARVRDQREIQLTGLGLVVGLSGTGDGRNTQFTIRMIGNMMRKMDIEVPSTTIKVKNVAAVMVTATVSPYVKMGGTFDVTVSSTGDATSIAGGTLLITILKDNNGNVFGKALGPVSTGGGAGNVAAPTGIVPNGGILLRELPTLAMDERSMLVTLFSPDFTTAHRLATAVNESFDTDIAVAQDAGSIIVDVPGEVSDKGDLVRFISEIEAVTFDPDERARVVINERTGTIIAGENVSLGAVAITHCNLSLSINQQAQPQQPGVPGQAAPVGDRMISLSESANVNEVAQALNLIGVTPSDLIAIFQALKRSGSLRAELVIM